MTTLPETKGKVMTSHANIDAIMTTLPGTVGQVMTSYANGGHD